MKEKRIMDALGQVDEQYIEEAAQVKKRKPTWPRWGALAACLALMIGIGFYLGPDTIRPPEPTPTAAIPAQTPTVTPSPTVTPTPSHVPTLNGLPILPVEFKIDGMGFEGLMQYDPAELSPNNPWSEEAVLEALPVYRNLAYSGDFPVPAYFGEEELLRRAEEVAAALDTSIESTEYSYASRTSSPPRSPEEESVVYRIKAETPLGEIEVDGTGGVSIFFDPAIDLPGEYSFTDYDTSDEDAEKTIAYLLKRFSSLYAPETPAIVTGGDYNIYGQRLRDYRAYDGGGDMTRRLLSYCFDGISFYANDEGQLWIIRLGSVLEAAEKLGDYPIITAQEARDLLLDGSYLTTVPSEYLTAGEITEDAIVRVELVYRTSLYEQTFMPYYRFYVELGELHFDHWAEGLINYGAYYVPAVEGEYLSVLPTLGELRFN